jgi:prepilin-type N-terminal cleavage/methylation domain-containing protein
MKKWKMKRTGFSMVELVIVIVILGIIAAIAIPRISSGSKNAGESALRANLATIRNAIDWYYGEHNTVFPGVKAAGGVFGVAGSQEAFTNQLLHYTKTDGTVSASLDAAFPYGPYVRGSFPVLPVGSNAGKNNIKIVDQAELLIGTNTDDTSGWIYNPTTGQFIANLPDAEVGNDGVKYNTW